jgi:hypothetical protein
MGKNDPQKRKSEEMWYGTYLTTYCFEIAGSSLLRAWGFCSFYDLRGGLGINIFLFLKEKYVNIFPL